MLTQSTKLSASLIPTLKKTGKEYKIVDHEVVGLHLRVSAIGTKTYHIKITVGGKLHQEKVGSADILPLTKARELARKRIGQLVNDRIAPPAKVTPLFEEVVADWENSASFSRLKPSTQKGYLFLKDRIVLPEFTGRRIGEITRADIQAWLERVFKNNGARTSTLAKVLLGRVFEHAVGKGHLDINLPKNIKPLAKPVIKERLLSEHEIKALWRDLQFADRFNQDVRDVIAFALITGQRRTEVALLDWREVNLEKREWFIPAARTKANRGHLVYLSDLAMEILNRRKPKNMPTRNADQRVFPIPPDAATLVCRRMAKGEGYSSSFSPHDLRRTFATISAGVLKTPEDIVERVLNHRVGAGKAIRHYNHYGYADEKRDALIAWSNYLAGLRAATEYEELSPSV